MANSTSTNANKDRNGRVFPSGLTIEEITEALTTGDLDLNDTKLLYEFPAEAWLPWFGLRIKSTDLDTGVAAVVLDFGIGDSDGVIDTTLISGSTIGQAGGVDDTDATVAPWVDVSGKYLIVKVTTAPATAAAGTLTIGLAYTSNLHTMSGG